MVHTSQDPPGTAVELRLLSALVTVADEASVSAAAARLRVAQPSLSRQLRLLERRLGLPLFERSGRRLRVTTAAQPVVDAARRALAAADDVVRTAHRAADGRVGRLAIAVLPSCSPVLLVDALAAFRGQHPQVETSIVELTDSEQHRALREGRIDVGLALIEPPPHDLPHQVLLREQVCLVVPSQHRLATAGRARLEDLTGEQLIFFSRADQPVGRRWLTDQLRAAGVPTEPQQATLTNIVATVAAGLAVTVMLQSFESILRPPGVRFIPLDDLAIDLIMAWRPGPEPAVVRAFRREITRLCAD
jgi:DNA-binding transcriptional LysR family regulator